MTRPLENVTFDATDRQLSVSVMRQALDRLRVYNATPRRYWFGPCGEVWAECVTSHRAMEDRMRETYG